MRRKWHGWLLDLASHSALVWALVIWLRGAETRRRLASLAAWIVATRGQA